LLLPVRPNEHLVASICGEVMPWIPYKWRMYSKGPQRRHGRTHHGNSVYEWAKDVRFLTLETCRVGRGMPVRDLLLAWRTLRNSLIFTFTAALTIALGVGASTAIFSVTNAVLLRPLPYKDPDKLVILPTDMRNRGVKDFPLSNADFIDLREGTKAELE